MTKHNRKMKEKNVVRDCLTNKRVGNKEVVIVDNAVDYVKKMGYIVSRPLNTEIEKTFVIALVSLFIMFILVISSVSAIELTKEKVFYNTSQYGEVLVKSKLLNDDILKVSLNKNSAYCTDACYAEGTTTLYKSGYLIDNIEFIDLTRKDIINKNYKIYIQDGVKETNYYEPICELKKDIFDKFSCVDIKKTIINPNWKLYNNEILPIGVYNWRIEANKQSHENIDWIGQWSGFKVEEWAVWGGVVSTDGEYSVHTFKTNGTFNYTGDRVLNVSVLVVAGGGGGSCGGGGAGGLIYNLSYLIQPGEVINVTIGSGGAGQLINTIGGNGTNSSFGLLRAFGGGGGSWNGENPQRGGSGGGGGCTGSTPHNGGIGYTGQGFDGGNTAYIASPYPAGGGGGSTMKGGNGTSAGAGSGGNGTLIGINGTNVYYAGGGGGGTFQSGTPGIGGLGGGGNGGSAVNNGGNGTANTGGGGGGAGNGGRGGNGGSGIVIVRYKTSDALNVNVTYLSITDNSNTFQSNGTAILLAVINGTNGTAYLRINNTNVSANVSINSFSVNYFLNQGTYNYQWFAYGINGSIVPSEVKTFIVPIYKPSILYLDFSTDRAIYLYIFMIIISILVFLYVSDVLGYVLLVILSVVLGVSYDWLYCFLLIIAVTGALFVSSKK